MQSHVLSNSDVISILYCSAFFAFILFLIFGALAERDASPEYKKGLFVKIIQWILLLLFISELSYIIYKLIEYPWDINPKPSRASVYRELIYMGSGHPIFGWANDYQLEIVGRLGRCLFAFCWTTYAFCFEKSNTTWWKKACKVIAYLLISIMIIGFNIHGLKDLLTCGIFLIPAVILLLIARVKRPKTIVDNTFDLSSTTTIPKVSTAIKPTPLEDHCKYMPHQASPANVENVSNSTTSLESYNITTIDSTHTNVEKQKYRATSTIYCKHCGKEIEEDSSFCKYCGKSLK